jgi:hypothetical protein
MSYQDPENTLEIINNIKSLKTIGEVHHLVLSLYPEWILGNLSSYSLDYSSLQTNWENMCKILAVEPSKILIVDDFEFDDNTKILCTFSELFTRSGFVVRRKSEIISCGNCGLAIPTPEVYKKMKENNVEVPETWSQNCQNC